MQNTLREKIIEILKTPSISIYLTADSILSLIIESLPEEKRKDINKGGGQYGHPETDFDTGYNAYREELIKMLKGV